MHDGAAGAGGVAAECPAAGSWPACWGGTGTGLKVCEKCARQWCRSAGQGPFAGGPRKVCHRRVGLCLAYFASLQPAAFLYIRFLLRHKRSYACCKTATWCVRHPPEARSATRLRARACRQAASNHGWCAWTLRCWALCLCGGICRCCMAAPASTPCACSRAAMHVYAALVSGRQRKARCMPSCIAWLAALAYRAGWRRGCATSLAGTGEVWGGQAGGGGAGRRIVVTRGRWSDPSR